MSWYQENGNPPYAERVTLENSDELPLNLWHMNDKVKYSFRNWVGLDSIGVIPIEMMEGIKKISFKILLSDYKQKVIIRKDV